MESRLRLIELRKDEDEAIEFRELGYVNLA